MDAPDAHTHPLADLGLAEDAFQQARTRLKEAEADRYASIWTALTETEDLTELRAMLPPTVTAQSLRAAVRRHATNETGYIQPELFEDVSEADPETATHEY